MIKHLLITVDTDKADPLGGIPLETPAVEVVRCGDCEYSRRKGEKCYRVITHDIFGNPKPTDVKPDGYCHRGERREDA